jgi:hypothetical protein
MKVIFGLGFILIGILGLVVEFLVWMNNIWVTLVMAFVLCILGGALIMASLEAEEEKNKLIDRGSFAKYVEKEGEENSNLTFSSPSDTISQSWTISGNWSTTPIFTCTYCYTDITDDGIIKRGKIFCNTDCAIKYSLQEAV